MIGMSINASVDNQEAMRTGGASFLLPKEAVSDQLFAAIQSAMRGSSEPGSTFIRPLQTARDAPAKASHALGSLTALQGTSPVSGHLVST